MAKKLGQWLSHALSGGNSQRRLEICTQLLSRSRRFDWLDTVVNGDEDDGGEFMDLPIRTAAGQHDSYCRGPLRSTAKIGPQDQQGAPEARQRSLAAR
ncbi:hypothetical protein RB195_005271 [Necator americanus]|uniref:Uncharacterized protein n=1 Tax=Necator americanus TaxID=51031 RepID=A0ABR1BQ91_NECAM